MGLFRRLVDTFRRDRLEADAQDELAFHMEQRVQELMRSGYTPDEARLVARQRIGNGTLASEAAAEADLVVWLENWKRDFQLAFRSFKRFPVFATTTVVSLALGLGVNTVVFTAMKHVVIDRLPVPDPDRLVILHSIGDMEGHIREDGMQSHFSYPQYRDVAAASTPYFDGVLARLGSRATLTHGSTTERIRCELVSGNYFQILGVTPWRGRLLRDSDDRVPGGHPVAVLSYAVWNGAFGADPNIIGRTVRLNGYPYQIVGIAPPQFYGIEFDSPAGVFVPMMMKAQITPTWDGLKDRLDHWAVLMGRLRNGVDIKQARAAMSVLYPPIRNKDLAFIQRPSPQFLREFSKTHIELAPGGKGYADMRQSLDQPLRFLTAMVTVVLLITIVNVANLLVARSAARRKEMAVRLSIGAGRAALIRQVLVESVVLALLGGALGVTLAYAGTPAFLRLFTDKLSATSLNAHPDALVLFVMGGAAMLAGLAFGLAPALYAARTPASDVLKETGTRGHTGGHLWFRRTLVGSQLAFSLLLLTGALLFVRSLRNLQQVNVGFDTDHVVTFKVDPSASRMSQEQVAIYSERVLTAVSALPHAVSAGLGTMGILEGDQWGMGCTVEGQQLGARSDELRLNAVDARFLQTLRVPMRAGRSFTEHDMRQNVAVVNETFARYFLNGANPVGRHFQFGSEHGTPHFDWTIIGLAADTKPDDLLTPPRPFAYIPYLTQKDLHTLVFLIRSDGNDGLLMEEVKAAIKKANASVPIYDLRTLDRVVDQNLSSQNALATLSVVFAALAITLALIGLYGVVSYSVVRRTREFGIRMAVGAKRRDVIGLVLRDTAVTVTVSVLVALPFVLLGGRWVESLLYGVKPGDPSLCVVAVLIIVASAISAAAFPARQAAAVEPQSALRAE